LKTVTADIRITTRISKNSNEWLDDVSKETGIPKSTLIKMAVEKFRKEVDEKGGIY